MGQATLQLELTNASDCDLNDFVRIELFSASGSTHTQNNARIQRNITLNGIEADGAGSLYKLVLTPSNYRLVQIFIMLADGKTRMEKIPFPVDPARVVSVRGPAFGGLDRRLQALLTQSEIPRFQAPGGGFLQGNDLYQALDGVPKLKACLLNVATKSVATPLGDGSTCLDHYKEMIRMEQDRLFIQINPALVEEVENSPLFHSVSAALHDPVPGYTIMESFKTLDRYGNLQLTFQRRGTTGSDDVADVDIDDAQGIEHIFQVLRNSITGPTNPYDIHDILVMDQHLDPGYSFVFPQAAAVGQPV
jgi:hypothetical protein